MTIFFSSRKLFELKTNHPEALVLAHPECDETVLDYADVVGSTSLLLKTVEERPEKTFVVATETGIFHQMKKLRPDAELIQAPFQSSCACNDCPYMKLNSLEKIESALQTLTPEVQLPTQLMEKAKVSLDRMMALTQGQSVQWPESFSAPTVSI